jgi:dTDP-4-dehydrorhamnose 3,5-epimerase
VEFLATELEGVIVVVPDVHRDDRGFFVETYHRERYARGGIDATFVQDNHSRSTAGTVRGLHAQLRRPQAKLVRASRARSTTSWSTSGRGSPTFKRWIGVTLSSDNFRQIYVPAGFAHGLCVTSEIAEVEYKCSDLYDPATSSLAVERPGDRCRLAGRGAILSGKDRDAPPLAEWLDRLPIWSGSR